MAGDTGVLAAAVRVPVAGGRRRPLRGAGLAGAAVLAVLASSAVAQDSGPVPKTTLGEVVRAAPPASPETPVHAALQALASGDPADLPRILEGLPGSSAEAAVLEQAIFLRTEVDLVDPFAPVFYTHDFDPVTHAFLFHGGELPTVAASQVLSGIGTQFPGARALIADAVIAACLGQLAVAAGADQPLAFSDHVLFSRDGVLAGGWGALPGEVFRVDPAEQDRFPTPRLVYLGRVIRDPGITLHGGGLWDRMVRFALEADPEARGRWEVPFERVARAFADQGRYTSALLMHHATGAGWGKLALARLREALERIPASDRRRTGAAAVAFGTVCDILRSGKIALPSTRVGDFAEVGRRLLKAADREHMKAILALARLRPEDFGDSAPRKDDGVAALLPGYLLPPGQDAGAGAGTGTLLDRAAAARLASALLYEPIARLQHAFTVPDHLDSALKFLEAAPGREQSRTRAFDLRERGIQVAPEKLLEIRRMLEFETAADRTKREGKNRALNEGLDRRQGERYVIPDAARVRAGIAQCLLGGPERPLQDPLKDPKIAACFVPRPAPQPGASDSAGESREELEKAIAVAAEFRWRAWERLETQQHCEFERLESRIPAVASIQQANDLREADLKAEADRIPSESDARAACAAGIQILTRAYLEDERAAAKLFDQAKKSRVKSR